MLVTHASHVFFSFAPVEHSLCAQVPPPQLWWQTELTSPTQIESHAVVQQYEAEAQTSTAHGSQPLSRAPPVEQIG